MASTTTAITRIGVGGPVKNYALPIGAKAPTTVVARNPIYRKGPMSVNALTIKV